MVIAPLNTRRRHNTSHARSHLDFGTIFRHLLLQLLDESRVLLLLLGGLHQSLLPCSKLLPRLLSLLVAGLGKIRLSQGNVGNVGFVAMHYLLLGLSNLYTKETWFVLTSSNCWNAQKFQLGICMICICNPFEHSGNCKQ